MRDDILQKLYSNSIYLEYLRNHPKWYYFLEQNPNNFVLFENTLKQELKITTYDKLENLKNQIHIISKFMDYFKK